MARRGKLKVHTYTKPQIIMMKPKMRKPNPKKIYT